MTATESLSQEHRVIEQVLGCLLEMASRAERSSEIDVASADSAVRFLKTFADACHHKKEEEVLFPALERKGVGPTEGPVAVMLEEHVLGRRQIARIEAAIADARSAAQAFGEHVRAYVDLLRQHIDKEDHVLFRLANAMFSTQEALALEKAFQSTEHALGDGNVHARMLEIAEDLGRRFGVTRGVRAPQPMSPSCLRHIA